MPAVGLSDEAGRAGSRRPSGRPAASQAKRALLARRRYTASTHSALPSRLGLGLAAAQPPLPPPSCPLGARALTQALVPLALQPPQQREALLNRRPAQHEQVADARELGAGLRRRLASAIVGGLQGQGRDSLRQASRRVRDEPAPAPRTAQEAGRRRARCASFAAAAALPRRAAGLGAADGGRQEWGGGLRGGVSGPGAPAGATLGRLALHAAGPARASARRCRQAVSVAARHGRGGRTTLGGRLVLVLGARARGRGRAPSSHAPCPSPPKRPRKLPPPKRPRKLPSPGHATGPAGGSNSRLL